MLQAIQDNFWIIQAVVATSISAVGTLFLIWQGFRLHHRQLELSQSIHDQQILLAQRQLLVPLWGHINRLSDINPASPVWKDVVDAVNILELVAVSWEGQLIDEDIIRRIFSASFIEFYDKINRCVNQPDNMAHDGPGMLRRSPVTMRLYRILTDEHTNRGALNPLRS